MHYWEMNWYISKWLSISTYVIIINFKLSTLKSENIFFFMDNIFIILSADSNPLLKTKKGEKDKTKKE